MTASGGIKFLKSDKALAGLGTTITASSNNSVAFLMTDGDKATRWESLASDDTTTETIELTFSAATTIDRLFLVSMNFKEFVIQYDAGAGYLDFTNVSGIDGALSGITETAFAQNTAYYSFDSVSALSVRIQAVKTQVVDAEKTLASFTITEELGSFLGFPVINGPSFDNNASEFKALSHKKRVIKSNETMSFAISYTFVPNQEDVDLVAQLHESSSPFLVWICGGFYGSTKFRYPVKGFRLEDLYNVQTSGNFTPELMNGIYILPVGVTIGFQESV